MNINCIANNSSALGASDVIAIIAALIAFATFFVYISQARIARTHNEFSIRPLIYFNTGMYGRKFVIEFQNKGMGPGVITNIMFVNKGRDVYSKLGFERLLVEFSQLGIAGIDECILLTLPHAISPNEIQTIFSYEVDEGSDTEDAKTKIKEFFRASKIKINFESMYKIKDKITVEL